MRLGEFKEWAEGKGAITPLLEDEMLATFPELKEERTERQVHTYVFPSGRLVRIYSDREDTIVEVGSGGDTLWRED